MMLYDMTRNDSCEAIMHEVLEFDLSTVSSQLSEDVLIHVSSATSGSTVPAIDVETGNDFLNAMAAIVSAY